MRTARVACRAGRSPTCDTWHRGKWGEEGTPRGATGSKEGTPRGTTGSKEVRIAYPPREFEIRGGGLLSRLVHVLPRAARKVEADRVHLEGRRIVPPRLVTLEIARRVLIMDEGRGVVAEEEC